MTHRGATVGLWRRLLAIAYDGLLLSGVLFLAGLPLPALPEALRANPAVDLAIQLYLLLVCLLYFGWFWTHGGQTLGMRAWGVRVVAADGAALTRRAAVVRFVAAAFSWGALGLGFWWVLVDRERRAWHDRLSGSRLVRVPPPKRDGSRLRTRAE